MHLFVSDMHFGRDDPARERIHEQALIACLRRHEPDIEHLYLLGDVFDQYIEYRHLVPKGLVRFQGLLAEWTDRGIPVTYLTGNHDPWHIDYFEREMGVRLVRQGFVEPLHGVHVYMDHGDGIASRFPMFGWIKKALLHPVPVALYRALLPGDAGFRLALWTKRRLHTDVVSEEVVLRLRDHALALLQRASCDVVVMGHSHCPELVEAPSGVYVNTGSWRLNRTFACLEGSSMQLYRWDDARAAAGPVTVPA